MENFIDKYGIKPEDVYLKNLQKLLFKNYSMNKIINNLINFWEIIKIKIIKKNK